MLPPLEPADPEGGLSFLRGRTRPATQAIVAFIDEHKDRTEGGLRWGIESISAVLTQHGVKTAPSTYYDDRGRGPSSQTVSDERWKPIILTTWQAHRKVLEARKLWLRLRRDGQDMAGCTVERLMRDLGMAGMLRGKRKRSVDTDLLEPGPADLVDRHFARFRTNQLWVTDFTYVWTWSGWVYLACVFDAHSRRIIGWRAATAMTTPLVLDCLDMALFTRRREGVTGFAGLTYHTDAGSVYTSIAFTDRLVEEGIDPSVGSVGHACDNSLEESQIGLYRSELIHHEGPWRDVVQVEAANASWVLWFNSERTHGSIEDLTPLEVEQLDYARNEPVERAG